MIDITEQVNSAVTTALKSTGLQNTTANRLTLLRRMHTEISADGPIDSMTNLFLMAIENQVTKLESEND